VVTYPWVATMFTLTSQRIYQPRTLQSRVIALGDDDLKIDERRNSTSLSSRF
jgi:hypothetical protein